MNDHQVAELLNIQYEAIQLFYAKYDKLPTPEQIATLVDAYFAKEIKAHIRQNN